MGVYLHLIPAGVGRAGDCIYINTPLKQLRPRTKQQRLASHILMASAAPRRLGTLGTRYPHALGGSARTPLKDPLLNNLKDSDLTHLLSATYNLRICHRSLARHFAAVCRRKEKRRKTKGKKKQKSGMKLIGFT